MVAAICLFLVIAKSELSRDHHKEHIATEGLLGFINEHIPDESISILVFYFLKPIIISIYSEKKKLTN